MSSMRHTIDELRYRWIGVRIGGPDATLRGQWVLLSVSLLAVFACFFAIGRLRSGGGTGSPSAAPSALIGPSGHPAVPTGLSGGSPIAGAVPVAIAVKPRPRRAVQPASIADLRTATPVQSLTAEAARSEAPASPSKAHGAPAREPVLETAPPKLSGPAPNGGGSGSSGSSGASSAKGGSGSSNGSSFETSE
jgi:hypothetical protein